MKAVRSYGFTLIELLIVVGIIAILVGVTLASISSIKAKSRDGQRSADVTTVMNVVYQYALDTNNQPPASITSIPTEICKTGASSCTGYIDLTVLTTSQKYIATLPVDPLSTSTSGTGYTIVKNTYGRITVAAPKSEATSSISITR